MFHFTLKPLRIVVFAIYFMTFAGLAFADDVTDAIDEALQNYKDSKYSEAMTSLNYASQLIGQKKGGDLQSFLPQPLDGWTAEVATSQAAGAAMFGGGVTAERRYSKDNGSASVRIVTDSPLLQSIIMMFGNPAIAASDGGKMDKIAGQKAIVKYNASQKNGTITIVIANRFLVTIEGNEVSLDDLKAYAKGIDYKKLAAMQ